MAKKKEETIVIRKGDPGFAEAREAYERHVLKRREENKNKKEEEKKKENAKMSPFMAGYDSHKIRKNDDGGMVRLKRK